MAFGLTLFACLGLLVVWPRSPVEGVETTILGVLGSLTDVRRSLEEKEESIVLLMESPDPDLPAIERHATAADEIYRLARDFMEAGIQRYPDYRAYFLEAQEEIDRRDHHIRSMVLGLKSELGVTGEKSQKTSRSFRGVSDVTHVPYRDVDRKSNDLDFHQEKSERDFSHVGVSAVEGGAPFPGRGPDRTAAIDALRRRAMDSRGEARGRAGEPIPGGSRLDHEGGTTLGARPLDTPAHLMAEYREASAIHTAGSPGELEEARLRFERLLEKDPAFAMARYSLARVHLERGEIDLARQHADHLARSHPDRAVTRDLERAVIRAERNRPPGAAPTAGIPPTAPADPSTVDPAIDGERRAVLSAPGPDETSVTDPGVSLLPSRCLIALDAGPGGIPGLSRARLVVERPGPQGDSRISVSFRDPPAAPAAVGPVAEGTATSRFLADLLGMAEIRREGKGRLVEQVPGSPGATPVGLAGGARPGEKLDLARLRGATAATDPLLEGWVFARGTAPEMPEAAVIEVPWPVKSKVLFRYDPATARYHRVDASPWVDPDDGTPVTTTSVVLLGKAEDGARKALVYCQGRLMRGRFMAGSPRLVDANGAPLPLEPGPIWILCPREVTGFTSAQETGK